MPRPRNARCYRAYLESEAGQHPSIPYSTLLRYYRKGKISEQRFQQLRRVAAREKQRGRCLRAASVEVDRSVVAEDIQPTTGVQHAVEPGCLESNDNDLVEEDDSTHYSQDAHSSFMEYDSADNSESARSDPSSHTFEYFPDSTRSTCTASSNSDSSSDSDESIEIPANVTDAADMKFLNSRRIGLAALNRPLVHPLKITKFETLVMILHLSMRHGMTDVFVEDLMHFVNVLVDLPDAIPDSKYLFKKLFTAGSRPTVHFYCPDCELYLGSSASFSEDNITCEHCEWDKPASTLNGGFYFLTLDMKKQISDVLSRPHVKLSRKDRVEGIISDITDSGLYTSLQENNGILSNPNALTINFNTDGSPVFKSGPNSLWPINFVLNEIHPSQRFWAENMMLAGLWFGKSSASMGVFLKPFVEELKLLEKDGVVWKRDGVLVESPVFVLCCIADSVARPKVQNFHQFNGSFACPYCEHPNKPVIYYEKVNVRKKFSKRNNEGGQSGNTNDPKAPLFEQKTTLRYIRGDYPLRTNKKVRSLMKLVERKRESIMGVAGESVMCSIKHFDMVYGFGLDYMHAILIGVTKRLVGLWIDSTSNGEPYYIGLLVGRVDRRLATIYMPTGIRKPRPMSDCIHWKANEWRSFLLYYGLPCLVDVLPQVYYNHFKKLVLGIFILCKEAMLHDEIETANDLLQQFVWEYQDLYEDKNMVYNVHLTSHLAKVVSKLGPLWAYSAFPYESANGRLVGLAKGTTGVCTQIARKYHMSSNFSQLIQSNYEVSDDCLTFCSEIVGFKYAKHYSKTSGVTLLGPSRTFVLNEDQRVALGERMAVNAENVVEAHHTAVYNGKVYRGNFTSRVKRSGDSCVRLISGLCMTIDLIIKIRDLEANQDCVWCVGKIINVSTAPCPFMVPHIKRCCLDPYGPVHVARFEELATKCMFYVCDDKYFVSEFANFYETD